MEIASRAVGTLSPATSIVDTPWLNPERNVVSADLYLYCGAVINSNWVDMVINGSVNGQGNNDPVTRATRHIIIVGRPAIIWYPISMVSAAWWLILPPCNLIFNPPLFFTFVDFICSSRVEGDGHQAKRPRSDPNFLGKCESGLRGRPV